ncbi:MAG: NtaA/DmoA family FMN-dependent monooxygenase [Kocuria sp.]|uniref:NtaA/DmoA family FMN-dependent monooxygenase n=1 Tax=Kocuria TaxID=57493 RepID=UPI0011A57F9C|nr:MULTISPECIES: NtaA/DmoA family FMN-dependent monooxygenase [Kocuria]MBS6031190.1 NtaA/DmoA family FMN-dependent monooxygenase [Kocuria rhizophila]MDO4256782.1 NtaA/DmoA family FMN-dependent monooxygenase [Kocuria sp.]
MPRPLLFNAFEMPVPVHQSPGLWRHPEDESRNYVSPTHWEREARTIEAAGFHGIFLADVLGLYDVYGGTPDAALRGGVQVPQLDPLLLAPLLARATEHLAVGVTASVTYAAPYDLARRFATLDALTDGRIAWNVVTSYQESAARNLGLGTQLPHDERYDRADEYMDVVYALWEGSYAEDAYAADRDSGVVVDPAKVRGAGHHGTYFDVTAPSLTAPTRQRTPYLFQAGASPRGLAFAAKHAEAVFFSGPTPEHVARWTGRLREEAEAAGRDPRSVKAFTNVAVVVAETGDAAHERLAEYTRYVDVPAALALFGGWTGVDLSDADPDAPLEHVETDANRSALASFTTMDPDASWTPRRVAEFVAIGGRGPVITGSPEEIADELERWARVADVDGFNVNACVRPADFERFGRFVAPVLRERGVLAPAATVGGAGDSGTGDDGAARVPSAREVFGGAGPRLPLDHPGAAHRS